MGANPCNSRIRGIKETWNFHGAIYNYINNIYSEYGKLNGDISIRERNGKSEIEIKGILQEKTKKEKFYTNGIESENDKTNNNIKYYIINKISNEAYCYDNICFNKNGIKGPKITGKFIYKNNFANLDLDLYLPKKKNGKTDVIINNFQYKMLQLKDPNDIISNSICGMKNLTNTCYINSSFQILIHIPEFVEIIRNKNYFKKNVIEDINNIFNKILAIYKDRNTINPSDFVKNFKLEHPGYNNYYQMDSEMFLEDLLWNINFILGVEGNKRPIKIHNHTTPKEKLFFDYIKDFDEDSYYKINDLFYVCFVHEKKCIACNDKTYYFDETSGLKLNFTKTKYRNSIDLYTLIMDNFNHPTTIKSSIICDNCKNCFVFTEETRIAKLPKILILSLQKTNNENTEKFPWVVKFDNKDFKIGIRGIVDIDLCGAENCSYELFAINNHLGHSPKSGHYYSTIYLEKLDCWFSFNDESVESIKKPNPELNNYILFYKQK